MITTKELISRACFAHMEADDNGDAAGAALLGGLATRLYKLQKKVVQLEKESQWLPMDTAPRDGTEILVLFKRIGAKMVSWTTRDNEPCSEYAHWHVDDGKYDLYPLRGYNEEDDVGWKPQPRVRDDQAD